MDPYNAVGDHIGFETDVPMFTAVQLFMQRIERHFWTMVGPPVAYFEIGAEERVVYETIALKKQGGLDELVVHELCKLAWDEFIEPVLKSMPDDDFDKHSRLLFWRKTPMVSVYEGATVLRMRLAIPGRQIVHMQPGQISGYNTLAHTRNVA